jgi:hypothetical protein
MPLIFTENGDEIGADKSTVAVLAGPAIVEG